MTNFVITLKWVLLVITLTGVCADDTHGIEKRDTNSDSKKIVCYYTNWSVYRPGTAKFTPQNINPYLCTHLIYAFGGLDKENGLRPYDKYQDIEQGGYAKFTGLKTYNKNLKTMLAIGGWNEGSSRFSNLVADEDRRATFVKNVLKFLRQNNFDGLDLDWEYPAFRDGSKPSDKENYAALVKELREEFEKEASKTGRPRLLLTMAVPAGIEYIDKGYDIPKLNKYLDFLNILSYDYHSAYEPNVNHHSPLYSLQEESEYNFDAQLTIDYTVKHYLKKGADPEKLVLGIPTYGRSYTLFNSESTDLGSPADGPGEQGEATREKGYLAYYEICSNVANDEWKVIQTKKSAMGSYAYRGNQWVGYDDIDIVKVKANYVNEKSLGGIMFWSIDNDDFRGKCHGKQYPLIEAGKEAMLASSGDFTKTLSTASTEEKRIKLGTRKQRPKHHTTTGKPQLTTTKSTTTTTPLNPLSTPEPPTTPDSGTDFVCKEEGFFPHPRDCKKYFWCLDSGPSNLGIVAHQFTCPSGLLFNKAADSCDYSRNVICNKKDKSTTTTTTVKTTSGSLNIKQSTVAPTTTTTTTTTTETPSENEYEEQEDVESEEDPKAIKQLITLIKKLGGINELEKQLKLEDGAKEVTTPAISKNLYNKVFSNPTAARFRYQHRNAPTGLQNEDLSSNDDVPYRKEKPQYVTIQRSRPLKNIAQDTEDSGTANAKAIQPSRNAEKDYEDIIPEEEITTKYSSLSRSRMATNSRPSTLKYVVLQRNRPDKLITDEGESTSESSLPSTQKYITLIRNRTNNSITTSSDFSESRTESGSLQHATRPSTQANEPSTEKMREKVSEIETTTANTLPVTSAQNVTAKTSNPNTTNSDSTSNSPNTYLVFAQRVTDENQFKTIHDRVDFTPKPDEMEFSTESITTSIATTIITTFRESATEKTRIPLRMYREFLKKNRTEIRHDSATNIFDESKRQNNSSATMKLKNTTDVTVRQTPFNLRRISLNNLPTEVTTEKLFPHFRSSGRRNKTHYTPTSDLSSEVTSRGSNIFEGDIQPTTHRYYRFRTISTESNAEIDNFFKKRRSSTTQKSESKSNKTNNYFSSTTSKYVFGNKPIENITTTDNLLSSTYRNRFSKYRSQHSNKLDLDNGYGRVPSSIASVSDQLSEPNSNEKMEVYLKSQSNDQTVKTSKTAAEESNSNKNVSITTTDSFLKNHFKHRLYLTTDNLLRAKVAQPILTTTSVTLHHFRNKLPQTRKNNSVSVEKEDTEIITTTISSSSTDHFQITHDRGNNTADSEPADVHHMSNVFGGNASIRTLHIIENDSKTEAKTPTIKHRLSVENGTVLPNIYSSSTEDNVRYTVSHGTTRFLSNENFNKVLTEMAYSPATEVSQFNFYDRYSENKYKPEHSEPQGGTVHSKTNSRNNSRFLKNPESEYKLHSKDKDKVTYPYNYITEKSPLRDSPVYMVQKNKENQIEFEVRIRHQTDKPSSKQESGKLVSPPHEEYRTRGKKKFADSLNDANNLHTEYITENKASKTDKSILEGRHAQVYYSSPVAIESSRDITTFNPRILNRGSIKAKNSLSKAEIKEFVDLDISKSKPVNKIEETYYNSSPTIKNNFMPKEKIKEMFIENTDNFGFSKIYMIPNDFSDRFYDEATDQLNEAKEEFTAVSKYKDVNVNDLFRVSETKYSDEGTRHAYSVGEKSTPEKNHHKSSANTANTELPTRLRSNFRRNNQTQRTRFTPPTTTTTTTTEYSDVSKLSSRFRRRKVRPENRSINTANSENFLPLTEIETSTVTRHKNYDISHRGTSLVSDYLPIPAPFFHENQTHYDELITDNINSEDLQVQSINPPKSNNNNNDDISDLADPAVAAIAHLKTLPPASPQITFSRTPIQSLVTYTNEPQGQYNKIKSTFRTTTAIPIHEKKISYRRGPSKLLARTTTTTQLPSLQDIYNDYHDTDAEYHADPVDIPISGKVRIHSDGYIECLDMGNFPHPFSCRKFISCAKMEYDSLLGWEYTCPKGLSFDPIGGICNWAAGLGCKD